MKKSKNRLGKRHNMIMNPPLAILTHLVGIGMILFGQLKVCLFDSALVRPSIDSEHLVEISLSVGGKEAHTREIEMLLL